jgi:prepilin-type processing-associated H-X9-DG protein
MAGTWTGLWDGTTELTPARSNIVAVGIYEKGYNTNYVCGWHACRGGIKMDYDDATDIFSFKTLADGDLGFGGEDTWTSKALGMTLGPLTRRMVEASVIPSSNIGLVGDASPGDPKEAILLMNVTKDATNASANMAASQHDDEVVTFLEEGERLIEAFNDGPAQMGSSSGLINMIKQGAAVTDQMKCEGGLVQSCGDAVGDAAGGADPLGTGGGGFWLQDIRDWMAVHGGSCNVLMADNSVKEFADLNGDKYINPGFPIPSTLTDDELDAIGYRDDTVEAHPSEMFCGIFIVNEWTKAINFETD